MVDRDEEEEMKEESSGLNVKTQTHAELRRLAKKNLENADRVLAESGDQLLKNQMTDLEPYDQDRTEIQPDVKEKG